MIMQSNRHSEIGYRESSSSAKGKALLGLYIGMLVVICVISFTFGASFAYKDYLLGLPSYVPQGTDATMVNEDGSFVNISEIIASETTQIAIPEFEHIHNILLIGIDSRSKSYSKDGSGSRADIIMILTVNEKDGTIKLLSIARDSYAYIPGFSDPQKINGAMTYGGPELLMATIENSLRIELNDYAFVNFYHMEKVIDSVGGVYAYVSEAERINEGGLNSLLAGDNIEKGLEPETNLLQTSGTQLLNGRQAVMYSRIRKVGGGDYERSKRQVEVLESLLKRFMNRSLSGQASALEKMLPHVSTNIPRDRIEWYATTFLSQLKSPEFVYEKLPLNGYSNQGIYSDFYARQWSIRPDWNGMIPFVQEYIFGETFPVDPVRTIPNAPNSGE